VYSDIGFVNFLIGIWEGGAAS